VVNGRGWRPRGSLRAAREAEKALVFKSLPRRWVFSYR